jgi:hypothetical protein
MLRKIETAMGGGMPHSPGEVCVGLEPAIPPQLAAHFVQDG